MSTLNQKIQKICEVYKDEIPNKIVLCCSGGSDSQVLLGSFPHVIRKIGNYEIHAVGVNHGLRPEADSELDLAESLADDFGVVFHRKRISISHAKGESLQAIARNARYEVIRKVCDEIGTDFIVTAHHLKDKAETVLIRLLRNSNLNGLGVMDYMSQHTGLRIFRPMLDSSKEEIESYIKFRNIKYANDPSNENEDYLRVWVRNQLIPMLETKSPNIQNELVKISNEILGSRTKV